MRHKGTCEAQCTHPEFRFHTELQESNNGILGMREVDVAHLQLISKPEPLWNAEPRYTKWNRFIICFEEPLNNHH